MPRHRPNKKPHDDVQITDKQSFVMITPTSDAGRKWVHENVHHETWQVRDGGGIVVERRAAVDIVDAMNEAGLIVGGGVMPAPSTSFTVCVRNEALQQGHYTGTFATAALAEEYIDGQLPRSRSFVTFEVFSGTPKAPGKVVGVRRRGLA
jgi:hypothetical protein